MDLSKSQKLSGRYYWANPLAPLGPDDQPSPPTISIDLHLDPTDLPPREQLRAEMRSLVIQVMNKLDEEFYPRNFVNDVATGRASIDDFDEYIDRWHDQPDLNQELHDWLGLSWQDYATITQFPFRLEEVVNYRIKYNRESL